MKEMTIPATVENIEKVTEFVNGQLEDIDCPFKAQMQIDIAIDELFGNIAHYAYNPETGPATVRIEVTEAPISVIITFIDHGVPYDPLKKDDPDITRRGLNNSVYVILLFVSLSVLILRCICIILCQNALVIILLSRLITRIISPWIIWKWYANIIAYNLSYCNSKL